MLNIKNGKTSVVKQLAGQMGYDFLEISLASKESFDFQGVPYVSDHPVSTGTQKRTEFALTTLLPLEQDNVPNPLIVMFDEIQAADQRTFKTLYQVIQERTLDGRPIHPNIRIVAARNTESDGGGDGDLPAPLKNRMAHLHVRTEANDWIQWAITANLHPTIIAYIKAEPKMLYDYDIQNAEDAFPTPRSWHNLSKCLSAAYGPKLPTGSVLTELGQALVGRAAASKLKIFSDNVGTIPDIPTVIANPPAFANAVSQLPAQGQWLLALAMGGYATMGDPANNVPCNIDNIADVLDMLPRKEIASTGMFAVTQAPNINPHIMQLGGVSQRFNAYLMQNRKLLMAIASHSSKAKKATV